MRAAVPVLERSAHPPHASFEYVEGWGMAVGAHGRVIRPRSVEEVLAGYELSRREGATLGLRGSGCSYGDASVNAGGHSLDFTAMNRILAWDPSSGVAVLEPGVTIEELWKRILPEGWWPPVVPGTASPTIAGVVAMNIHGKNNFSAGTIGDWVDELDLALPRGEVRTCSREKDADLFHAAIGGFGMLGAFTRIALRTKRVYSGDVEVRAARARNLRQIMEHFEAHKARADYLVAWVDCFAEGEGLGRGQIHEARYLAPGEDPDPAQTLSLVHQHLPATILGVPKSEAWRVLRLFNNDRSMQLLNAAKFSAGRFEAMKGPFRQSLAAFSFLLDQVPNWKWAYGRTGKRGLIQYQVFLPDATAHDTYCEILRRNQRRGFVPYLGVFKRHRPDPFWLTHALDGWSLALDYKVTPENREGLWAHCADLTEIVLASGGKFYFAKDLVLGGRDMRRMLPADKVAAFESLKREVDPDLLLQTDLYRRVFGTRV
jgi:decaprenylphospho-beta-D-ribofuranose 2-oxidase